MDSEEDDIEGFIEWRPPCHPEDLLAVSELLRRGDVLVPGFIPPEVGLYDVYGQIYHHFAQNGQSVLLPDRNIVTRLAKLARGEPVSVTDGSQERMASGILAFAQCFDYLVDPSIAAHELASTQGNLAALDEIGWFRCADNIHPKEWIDIALGRADRIASAGNPVVPQDMDLAKPLARWRRNYVVGLKIAELELHSVQAPVEKVSSLLDWMCKDFLVAGPSMMLACLYFAPRSPPRERLMKKLRSPDRSRAIDGIRNAAWDITYVSHFTRLINDNGGKVDRRYILASLDSGFRRVASLTIGATPEQVEESGSAEFLEPWWSETDRDRIRRELQQALDVTKDPERYKHWEQGSVDYVGTLIESGEARIRAWQV